MVLKVMTVSIEATSKKYHGRKAATYEAVRKKQKRWHRENELVEKFLGHNPGRVLDVPVGTGRFLWLYERSGATVVDGIDISEEMLALASAKLKHLWVRSTRLTLKKGDARNIECANHYYTTSVCIRFLDLIDETAMRAVMHELFRVTKKQIVLTIRFGQKYLPKSNTAEHDKQKFRQMVRRAGWKITRAEPIRNAGWHVIKLERM